MITLGSEHHDIDFEAVWQERLQISADDHHAIGRHGGMYAKLGPRAKVSCSFQA